MMFLVLIKIVNFAVFLERKYHRQWYLLNEEQESSKIYLLLMRQSIHHRTDTFFVNIRKDESTVK
jgi:hypothetical protein